MGDETNFKCTKGSEDTVFHHRGTVARSFTETFFNGVHGGHGGGFIGLRRHGGYNGTIE
jgi:hypothetical protein